MNIATKRVLAAIGAGAVMVLVGLALDIAGLAQHSWPWMGILTAVVIGGAVSLAGRRR
jgi:hypothetical protein